jgi:hypothetical protein
MAASNTGNRVVGTGEERQLPKLIIIFALTTCMYVFADNAAYTSFHFFVHYFMFALTSLQTTGLNKAIAITIWLLID